MLQNFIPHINSIEQIITFKVVGRLHQIQWQDLV